jgi:hypothetical protein
VIGGAVPPGTSVLGTGDTRYSLLMTIGGSFSRLKTLGVSGLTSTGAGAGVVLGGV